MGSGERKYVTLTGGAPWGFRLQGGGDSPLRISKIRKKSQAHNSGVLEGDALMSINGVSIRGKSHEEAMQLMDSGGLNLTLEIIRGQPSESAMSPSSMGQFVNGHSSHLSSSSSLQSFSMGSTQNTIQTNTVRQGDEGQRNTSFVRHEQQTTSFSPKPWNSSMYQNQIPKPFTPSSISPAKHIPDPPMFSPSKFTPSHQVPVTNAFSPAAPQVQVSAMYSGSESKENVPPPPRRLSLQPTSNRSPRFSPRPTSPAGGDKMPALNVWALKDLPRYTRPTPPPPKKVVQAPPPPPPPVKKPEPIPEPIPPPPPPAPVIDPHLFAPPVEISLERHPKLADKKLYGDSAFYNDPDKNFPTIEEQMKLCKAIAQSLTSAANKKARGARMFAKRQKKAPNWVHDDLTANKVLSSAGSDVGNLLDLESELSHFDGGSKPLLSFRVPTNLKNRVNSPESTPKMSLSKDEFEKLRLKSSKNEHKNVSPDQCFDLVANLKSGKGRGAKLFEKRQKKAEKWVIDENNAKKAAPAVPLNRLDSMLMSPPKPYQSPWEAASKGEDVNSAFEHLSELEKQQRLNQILGYKPAAPRQEMPAPSPQPMVMRIDPITSLKAENKTHLLEGTNFNRVARGWTGFGSPSGGSSSNMTTQQYVQSAEPPPVAPKPQKAPIPQRDYNPKPRAWMGSQVTEEDMDSSPEPMMTSPAPAVWSPVAASPADKNMFSPSSYSTYSSGQPSPNYYGQNVGMYNNGYSSYPVELPGSDL